MSAITKLYTRTKEYGFSFVCQTIMRNKVYRGLDKAVDRISKALFSRRPLKENTIILESHNDFDSNGGAFYDYLIRNHYNDKYQIVWLLRNRKPRNLPHNITGFNMFRPSFRKSYYLYTAKYIVTCHLILGSRRNGQISYYLTHGAVGLKAFKGYINLPDTLNYCLGASEFLNPILAEQYMLSKQEKQIILGYPSHDVLYEAPRGELKKITDKIYHKMVLWMPTFRKNVGFERNDSNVDSPMGIPIIENEEQYQKLNDYLKKENVLLILKMHPMQDLTKIHVRSLSNICVLDGNSVKKLNVENYHLMKEADALISDYSSVAYDFLHLDRPIGYTMDDANSYKLGFIVPDPHTLMAGEEIICYDDLIKFLSHVIHGIDPYKEKRKEVFDKVFKYHDGNSCKRLAKHMGLTL